MTAGCSGSAVWGDGADGFGGASDGRGAFARLTAGAGAVLGGPGDGQVCFCQIDGRLGVQVLQCNRWHVVRYLESMLVYCCCILRSKSD